MSPEERLERYADLAVRVGVNLQEGQDLHVHCLVEHAPLAREVAKAGYRAGARRVDGFYGDAHVRKALVQGAPEDSLGWSPPWVVERYEWMQENRAANLAITGDPEPDLFGDVDPARLAQARMRRAEEVNVRGLTERLVSWAI